MPERPPFYKQETEYSCVPACLRMVLASLGVIKTEQELREMCDCTTLEGAAALKMIDAARALGFTETRKQNLSLDDLEYELERGLFPITYVGVSTSASKLPEKHAVVVVAIEGDQVQTLDPARGEIILSREEFFVEWNAMRRLTVLIE